MIVNSAAVTAVAARYREAAKTGSPLDPDAAAVLAVTTLQGLGWRPPSLRDANASTLWATFVSATRKLSAEPTQADYVLTPTRPEEEP